MNKLGKFGHLYKGYNFSDFLFTYDITSLESLSLSLKIYLENPVTNDTCTMPCFGSGDTNK